MDIVEALRTDSRMLGDPVARKAADEIERLRFALKPFGEWDEYDESESMGDRQNPTGAALGLAAKAQEDRYKLAKQVVAVLDDNALLLEDDHAAKELYRFAMKFI